MSTDVDSKPDGTQAIRRAAAMLRKIARGPKDGVSLREVSESLDLSRSTTHRILKCLLEERLVEHGPEGATSRYVIGSLAFELGLVATNRLRQVETWRAAVDRCNRLTGATTYLMGRTGNESICLYAAEGSSVVRVIPVTVGQRRPLGVGAGATALLAAAADGDFERVLNSISGYLHQYCDLTTDDIRANVAAAKKSGFAESLGRIAPGVYGLGAAIPEGQSSSTLAISIAVHESMVTEAQKAAWKRELLDVTQSRGKHARP